MGAIDLHARASKDFEAKLAATQKLLIQAASEFAPLKQASSLGAEDVVITHLINSLELDIPVFVLETGALHQETLDLLARTQASSRTAVEVYRPVQESVVHFVGREGKDAMYRSIALRKECCAIRKLEPLARALEGQKPGSRGCAASSPTPVPRCRRSTRRKPAPRSTPWPTGPGATSGTTSASTGSTTTRCTTSSSPASAAHRARARSPSAKTSAPAAGGGKPRARRSAVCTSTAPTLKFQ